MNAPMDLNNPNNETPEIPVEVRVENLGRFGNYFFTSGYSVGFGETTPVIRYAFKELDEPVAAEFSFSAPPCAVSGADDADGRRSFLELLWINDGYKLKVNGDFPLTVERVAANVGNRCKSVYDIREKDFTLFLKALESIGGYAIWTNRVVLEITNLQLPADKARFLKAVVDAAGWESMEAAFEKIHPGINDRKATPLLLDVCCHWFAGMDARYLPSDLKIRFSQWAAAIDVTRLDRELLQRATFQLTRFNPNLACRLARTAITSLEFSRAELSAYLQHCFPRHSQWWLLHTMNHPGLGSEQIADAMNVAGTAAATQAQPDLAILSYEAALQYDPTAQSAAWNLGCMFAEQGRIGLAEKAFGRITRHYPNQSLSTRWPQIQGQPWPAAPQDTTHFQLPADASGWPRITVITPSFNQGGFIAETILSILNQCYPNLQYIVVDGASTDDTGTVLECYRDRIDHLIIEPDNGQTEAINKGLRIADGELITWLNSDDMHAPGTLHQAALKWLENQADVIAGICLEHEDHRFRLINRPAAGNNDFNPPQLARIFKYWFKGYYFYQPEAFFSRKILDAVGLLDESLYYSMDYDLWMRFAKAGAELDVVDWPFAFFRKHETQKTANLADCVEEQARVRNNHHELMPGEERQHQIQRALASLHRRKSTHVGILSIGGAVPFSKTIQNDLDHLDSAGFNCNFSTDGDDPRIAEADLIIVLVHARDELAIIKTLRTSRPDRLICGWFWASHRHPFENHAIAEALDIVLPGHGMHGEYLRNDQARHGWHLPLCVTQWAGHDATSWFSEFGNASRNPALFGNFVDSPVEPKDNEFLRQLMELLPGHALACVSEVGFKASLERPEKDRFAEWCRYQTSLILPHHNELPQQLFEALLAGQIPLVPEEVTDLDRLIPRELQESLPIIRYSLRDPSSCRDAYRKSCGHAGSEGNNGARRRHEYALAGGLLSTRVKGILDRLVLDCEF